MEVQNQIQVFENEQFGKIRTLIINGKLWFVAVDVCKALEIVNTTRALSALDDDEKMIVDLNTLNNMKGNSDATFDGWITNDVNVINEPGLYRLIFSSRKPKAKEFQRWIYHEVIPSIMHTGSYTLPNDEIIEPFPKPAKKNLSPHLDDPNKLCVYVASLENGTVKIGRSSDFCRRANEIKQEYQLNIMGLYNTGYLPFRLAATIEKTCHRKLAFCRVKNEIFEISFADACEEVCKITVDVIEQDRALYGKNWPDANSEYTYFLSRIPVPPMAVPAFIIVESFASYKPAKIVDALPPGFSEQVKARALPEQIEIAAAIAETLSLQTKIEMLLKCAELSPSKKRKSYFLNKVDALI